MSYPDRPPPTPDSPFQWDWDGESTRRYNRVHWLQWLSMKWGRAALSDPPNWRDVVAIYGQDGVVRIHDEYWFLAS